MNPRLKQIIEFVLPLIRPRMGYWIAKTLVGGGVAIMASPWWLPLIGIAISESFGIEGAGSGTTIIGFVLIFLGLCVYVYERRSDLSKDSIPDLIVLAHFAFFLDGQGLERCFIKISNSSPSKPVTVTHIDYVGSNVVPVLSKPLPKRLEATDIFEVNISLDQLPDAKSDVLLSSFRVTDSVGRHFTSVPNNDVSPIGYVA